MTADHEEFDVGEADFTHEEDGSVPEHEDDGYVEGVDLDGVEADPQK